MHAALKSGCHLLLLRCLLLWLLSSASPLAGPSTRARLVEGVPARPLISRGLLLRPRAGHIEQAQVSSCAHLAGSTPGGGVDCWWWRACRSLQTASHCIN